MKRSLKVRVSRNEGTVINEEGLASARVAGVRARRAMFAVCFICAVHLVDLIVTEVSIHAFGASDAARERLASLEQLGGAISTVSTVSWLLAVVAFLMWVSGAHDAANQLASAEATGPTPATVVWAYFIPFLNLVRPYEHMTILARLSDPRDVDLPATIEANPAAGYREQATRVVAPTPWSPPPLFIGAWWAGYVVLSLAAHGPRFVATGGPEYATLAHVSMFIDLWFIVTGAFCIAVIRGLSLSLRERARRLALVTQSAHAA